jgi:DNA transformation protein
MKGAVKEMSYFQPPASALDDGVRLCAWARKGVEAAARAAQRKKPAARKRG